MGEEGKQMLQSHSALSAQRRRYGLALAETPREVREAQALRYR
jgi:putative hemolysin